jgi:hypothetical protein
VCACLCIYNYRNNANNPELIDLRRVEKAQLSQLGRLLRAQLPPDTNVHTRYPTYELIQSTKALVGGEQHQQQRDAISVVHNAVNTKKDKAATNTLKMIGVGKKKGTRKRIKKNKKTKESKSE